MNSHSQEQFKALFLEKMGTFSKYERDFLHRILERRHVTRNTNAEFDQQLTLGQRLADRVAKFGGSWTFIIIFGTLLLSWIILNSFILANQNKAFDPYPYILLNLFLSMLAAIQAPIIMMSQNRQGSKDRLRADLDYQVNLKNELALTEVLRRLDVLESERLPLLFAEQNDKIAEIRQSTA